MSLGKLDVANASFKARDGAWRISLSISGFGGIDPVAVRLLAANPSQVGCF